jgi:hypothetical protein
VSSVRVGYDIRGPNDGAFGVEARRVERGGCKVRRSIIQRPKQA